MAITASFGFRGYWCLYLPLEGLFGIFNLFLCAFPDKCSRWHCIMNNFAIHAKFGCTSGLGAL